MRAPLDSTIGEEFENTRLPLGYFRGGKLPEPGRSQPCRCARQLRFAPTRDLFGSGRHPAEPPRGTSFWFWAGATRPAGSAGFECVFGLDSLVYSKIGRTHRHTQTNKTLSIFPPALAPTRPGLPCVYTHTSLDLTALDPYGDQNTHTSLDLTALDPYGDQNSCRVKVLQRTDDRRNTHSELLL